MTWQEVKTSIASGKTTVIIPTGGTEQNGPHIVLGKHTFHSAIYRDGDCAAATLAMRSSPPSLGMNVHQEGDITPPSGHMRFCRHRVRSRLQPLLLRCWKTRRAATSSTASTTICFVGEHGASQPVQKAVAAKLDAEWKAQGVRVLHVSNYYDAHNGQVEWAKKTGITDPDIEAHGGLADTSEMLAAHPKGVRMDLRAAHTPADMDTEGAAGSSLTASREIGAELLELKIRAAVAQIQDFQKPTR